MTCYYVVRRNADNSVWGISKTPFPWVPRKMAQKLEREFPLPPLGGESIKSKDPLKQYPRLPNGTRCYMYTV